MEFKWLEDFISIASTGSFSKSASERHTTQPTFSRRIQSLEKWVGAELVDRNSHLYLLTPAGKEFLNTAVEVSSRIKTERKQLASLGWKNTKTDIAIVSTKTLLHDFFPGWFFNLKQQVGDFTFSIKEEPFLHKRMSLVSPDIDFLLVYSCPDGEMELAYPEFESIKLSQEKFLPVSNANYGSRLLLGSLEKTFSPTPLVTYSEEDEYLSLLQDKIIHHNRKLRPKFEAKFKSPTLGLMKNFILTHAAVGWLPESLIKEELSRGEF